MSFTVKESSPAGATTRPVICRSFAAERKRTLGMPRVRATGGSMISIVGPETRLACSLALRSAN
ncbi:MAG: hypothetical protein ABW087_19050 [Candidatus Thiodiazotropha sp.]